MAFNHGATGHPANREQRSNPSSGAISLESLWSGALLELNLLCHRVRIHSGGHIFKETANSLRDILFSPKCFMLLENFVSAFPLLMMSALSFSLRFKACYPPFRGNHLYLFIFKVNSDLKEYFTEFPKDTMYCSLKSISKLLNFSRSKSWLEHRIISSQQRKDVFTITDVSHFTSISLKILRSLSLWFLIAV